MTRSDDRRPEPRLIYGAAHGSVIVGPVRFLSGEICPRLYEKFPPNVPPGNEGWGKRAVLDVEMIRAAT